MDCGFTVELRLPCVHEVKQREKCRFYFLLETSQDGALLLLARVLA